MGHIGKRQKKNRLRCLLINILFILAALFLVLVIIFGLLKDEPRISNESPSTPIQSISNSTSESDESPQMSSNNKYSRKEKCYTFLLAASDQSSGNADTIMVIRFDTIQGNVGIVSIPRDTLINPDDGFSSYPKINSTYIRGIDNLVASVSDLLGIPIDFYITVDVDGFVDLVNAIGGVDFNIPVHMSYDDPKQNLYIHFEPGVTHLSGKDALKVCRLRDNNDGTLAYPDYDIGRTRTQQQLLIAICKKVLLNPQKIGEYIEIFNHNVETNITFGNALWFVEPLLDLNLDQDVSATTLPGDGSVSYKKARYCYELYPDETVEIVNDLLSPYTTPITIEDMNIFSADREN